MFLQHKKGIARSSAAPAAPSAGLGGHTGHGGPRAAARHAAACPGGPITGRAGGSAGRLQGPAGPPRRDSGPAVSHGGPHQPGPALKERALHPLQSREEEEKEEEMGEFGSHKLSASRVSTGPSPAPAGGAERALSSERRGPQHCRRSSAPVPAERPPRTGLPQAHRGARPPPPPRAAAPAIFRGAGRRKTEGGRVTDSTTARPPGVRAVPPRSLRSRWALPVCSRRQLPLVWPLRGAWWR